MNRTTKPQPVAIDPATGAVVPYEHGPEWERERITLQIEPPNPVERADDELTAAIRVIEAAAKNPDLQMRLQYWLSGSRVVRNAILDRAIVNDSYRVELRNVLDALGTRKGGRRARPVVVKLVVETLVEDHYYRLKRWHEGDPIQTATYGNAIRRAADELGVTEDVVRGIWEQRSPNGKRNQRTR